MAGAQAEQVGGASEKSVIEAYFQSWTTAEKWVILKLFRFPGSRHFIWAVCVDVG